MVSAPECLVELLDMCRPLGQEQAMSAPRQCRDDIRDHLSGSPLVGDQLPVDSGDPTRLGRIGIARVAEVRLMQM